jgi:hypothetical protein
MSKSTARLISKLGLSLVAIGFFMPFTQKMNVFAILDNLSSMASWLDIDMGSYKFQIYLIFISSVIGVISLCLLYANKSISLAFDWCTVLIAYDSFFILLFRLLNLANEAMGGFGGSSSDLKELMRGFGSRSSDLIKLIGDNLQIGAYFIFIGLIISVVFLIVATFFEHGSTNVSPEMGLSSNGLTPKNVSSTENQVRLPSYGDEYIVAANTFIRDVPNFDAKEGKSLSSGDKAILEGVNENQDWFFIKTSDGKEGWCFSIYLKKC